MNKSVITIQNWNEALATNCVQISIISTLTVRICGQVCKRDVKERRRDNVDKNEANSFSSYIQPKSLAKYL